MAVKRLITLIYVQTQTRLAGQAHKWVPCPISPNAQENAQHTWHPGGCQVLFLFLQLPRFWQSSFTWQFHNPPSSSLKLLGGKMRPFILPSVKAYSCPNLVKTLLCASFFPLSLNMTLEAEQQQPKNATSLPISLFLSPSLTTNHCLLKLFSTCGLLLY